MRLSPKLLELYVRVVYIIVSAFASSFAKKRAVVALERVPPRYM